MYFRTFYGVRGEARDGLTCTDKSRTQQEYLKESLTSTIIDRFSKTGVLTPTCNPERVAKFGDFTQCPFDLLEAHERLSNVRSVFETLPSDVRARFGNNPLSLVQFLADSRNRSEAIKLGFIDGPVDVPVVKPANPVASDGGTKNDTIDNPNKE